MREIKFRGWNGKNKKWIYGYYFVNRGEHFISPDEVVNPLVSYEDFLVDKDSVGQYTGVKDKNGKEVYDGDIVSSGATTGVVVYDCEQAGFVVQKEKTIELRFYSLLGIEVIGNVHDNPELLTNNE
jgi:hypothetical protein|nr:MAG TPA: YopX protein [Caudoviricetes sp.]